jgi:hypothetical protein
MAAAPECPGVETALDWAETAAMLGDYTEAIAWLDYAESRSGPLSPALTELRRTWAQLADVPSDV